jgi:hypothetical protein
LFLRGLLHSIAKAKKEKRKIEIENEGKKMMGKKVTTLNKIVS